jgi:hypothetical protein
MIKFAQIILPNALNNDFTYFALENQQIGDVVLVAFVVYDGAVVIDVVVVDVVVVVVVVVGSATSDVVNAAIVVARFITASAVTAYDASANNMCVQMLMPL